MPHLDAPALHLDRPIMLADALTFAVRGKPFHESVNREWQFAIPFGEQPTPRDQGGRSPWRANFPLVKVSGVVHYTPTRNCRQWNMSKVTRNLFAIQGISPVYGPKIEYGKANRVRI
jgi:hypothetical protein